MLARPEFNTREDILLFLGSKPRDEEFYWGDSQNCACGQYAKARGKMQNDCWGQHGGLLCKLNFLAEKVANLPKGRKVANLPKGRGTFGALYDLAEREL